MSKKMYMPQLKDILLLKMLTIFLALEHEQAIWGYQLA
jgi:hypothetical protein